jgi:phosphodiesterase/alkaline phosphatase D-like protein
MMAGWRDMGENWTRRAFLGRASAVVAMTLTEPLTWAVAKAWAASPANGVSKIRSLTNGSVLTCNFTSRENRDGWGRHWLALHYRRRIDVHDGWARFVLPAGLSTTAAAQPMPVFIRDWDAPTSVQLMTFKTSNATLRPGLLLQGSPPFTYTGVTIEGDRLVLARYRRTKRKIVQRIAVPSLRDGVVYHLKVAHSGGRLRAKLWQGSREPDVWPLDVALTKRKGSFGVLLVHPTDLRPAILRMRRYRLAVSGVGAPTPPAIPFTISGIPLKQTDGSSLVGVRAASSIPSDLEFEWSHDPQEGAIFRGISNRAIEAPYTAKATLTVGSGEALYWRARARSLSSGAETHSEWQEVVTHSSSTPIVFAAASCAQLWGKPAYAGFTRALQAAGSDPIRTMVYQGDLGYANNSFRSCYLATEDFFADRFVRFLADPHFSQLRRTVSSAFTLDDHDYGPKNNASADQVEEWAIHLWNRLHADPSDIGYFDFRFGDVHCLTLDNRRYADPPSSSPDADASRLGAEQFTWMKSIVTGSDAELFVIFSAGIFASRYGTTDCFLFGWRKEYNAAMTLFHDVQLRGKRVVIISGDAHGLRVHHHPDPQARPEASDMSVVEFVCSGLEARTWSPAVAGDESLDPTRSVMGTSGLGLVVIDPPDATGRKVTLRAIAARPQSAGSLDLFPPLALPFRPAATAAKVPASVPTARPSLTYVAEE